MEAGSYALVQPTADAGRADDDIAIAPSAVWRQRRRRSTCAALGPRLLTGLGTSVLAILGVAVLRPMHGPRRHRGATDGGAGAVRGPADRIVQLDAVEDCHTAVRGETCHGDIMWAMEHGIVKNPSWYPDLTRKSTFEDFQRFMHQDRPRACPEPCPPAAEKDGKGAAEEDEDGGEPGEEEDADGDSEDGGEDDEDAPKKSEDAKVGKSDSDGLRKVGKADSDDDEDTPKESEDAKVGRTGGGEDKKGSAARPTPTPPPKAAEEGEGEDGDGGAREGRKPASNKVATSTGVIECHTAVPTEECYRRVVWVMQEGLSKHADWYKSLKFGESTFEEVQVFVHNERPMACPLPCDRDAVEADKNRQPTHTAAEDADSDEKKPSCHTAVSGEECYDRVMWVAKTGLRQHPDEYKGLSKSSSFEEIQQRLHKDRSCPQPCAKEVEHHLRKPLERPVIPEETTGTTTFTTTTTSEETETSTGTTTTATTTGTVTGTSTTITTTSRPLPKLVVDLGSNGTNASAGNGTASATVAAPTSTTSTRTTTTRTTSVTTTTVTKTTTRTSTTRTSTSTTTTTTTPCQTAEEGDKCHDAVMWVMKDGLFSHPRWYKGLSKTSRYEDVQARLHKDPKSLCPAPCRCHTAEAGSKCHKEVLRVLTTGIKEQPDAYEGLTSSSRFEDVQAHLHRGGESDCPTPCKAFPWGFPSLFCFSVVMPTGFEPEILRTQLAKGAGIFQCDEQAIYSEKHFEIGKGVSTIPFVHANVGVSKDGTAGNAELFMNVWESVKHDFRARNLDWTIKVDPDAVILPVRLRLRLAPHNDESVYVKNCGAYHAPGWPMMFGALEVFSRRAITAYFEGDAKCKSELKWKPWGEDLYMMNCLDFLGVGSMTDLKMSFDKVCKGWTDCGDGEAAAFHPFKGVDKWLECWEKTASK